VVGLSAVAAAMVVNGLAPHAAHAQTVINQDAAVTGTNVLTFTNNSTEPITDGLMFDEQTPHSPGHTLQIVSGGSIDNSFTNSNVFYALSVSDFGVVQMTGGAITDSASGSLGVDDSSSGDFDISGGAISATAAGDFGLLDSGFNEPTTINWRGGTISGGAGGIDILLQGQGADLNVYGSGLTFNNLTNTISGRLANGQVIADTVAFGGATSSQIHLFNAPEPGTMPLLAGAMLSGASLAVPAARKRGRRV
jgi:hypothetical protein